MKQIHDGAVRAIDWSHQQHGVFFSGGGTDDCMLKVWNLSTKELIQERQTNSQICSLIAAKNTNDIFTGHGHPNNQLGIWRVKNLKRVAQIKQHSERVL